MPRTDLLSLTADDLAELTNRGTVKRAQKELDGGDPTCTIDEQPDGAVVVSWSDGVTCRFPAGKTIHDAICSSGLSGLTRHVVRSVLAYQRDMGSATPLAAVVAVAGAQTQAPSESWDPGAFTDEDLLELFRQPSFNKAKARFDRGVLVELMRGAKPTARFLDEACTVRFAVPGDLRYATADCHESLWPIWVSLAVWSFRALPADQLAGLLSLQLAAAPVAANAFDDLHSLLDELCRDGFGGLSSAWPQRLARSEQRLREQGLAWPADLVLEFGEQQAMYQQRDARFDPDHCLHLLGELTARMRAISRGASSVPQSLIRGSKSDRATDIVGGRYVGVGMGVRVSGAHTTIGAYLQDVSSGAVAAVQRTFAHPDPTSPDLPKPYAALAATVFSRNVSLASLATSQILLKSGKRTASGQLILPRTTGSLTQNPQSFQWEQLKPPFAVDGLAALRARFRALPPAYLRPRRDAEDLHAVAITSASDVSFDPARQHLTAVLSDARGETAKLVHPFHSRGEGGFSELFDWLSQRPDRVRFVSGHVQVSSRGLVIRPVMLVVEDNDGRRVGLLPWVERRAASNAEGAEPPNANANVAEAAVAGANPNLVEQFLVELRRTLADLLVTGVQGDSTRAADIARVAQRSRALGFLQISEAISQLSNALDSRRDSLAWKPTESIAHLQQLCMIARIAAESSGENAG